MRERAEPLVALDGLSAIDERRHIAAAHPALWGVDEHAIGVARRAVPRPIFVERQPLAAVQPNESA